RREARSIETEQGSLEVERMPPMMEALWRKALRRRRIRILRKFRRDGRALVPLGGESLEAEVPPDFVGLLLGHVLAAQDLIELREIATTHGRYRRRVREPSRATDDPKNPDSTFGCDSGMGWPGPVTLPW